MSTIHMDSKARLVDLLSIDEENSRLSLGNFPNKRSIEAVYLRYKAENMLLQFARNPQTSVKLDPEPQPPQIPEGMEEEMGELIEEYNQRKALWNMAKQAAALNVSLDDYVHIKEHFIPFDRTINALFGVKGKRWHSLTKNIGDEQKKGLLAALGNSEKE